MLEGQIAFTMESSHFQNNVTSGLNLISTDWEQEEMTSRYTFMEEVKTFTLFKIANFINTYWFPVLVPIGLIGNILSFIVMIKPNNRKMSTCIYMAAISINDNLLMVLCCYDYLVSALQMHKRNLLECQLISVVFLFTLQNCTYLILAMTMDKYIAIKWPHRAAAYSTPGRTKWIVVGLCLCVFIYNIPHLFLSRVIGGQCFAYSVDKLITKVYSWLSFVLNAVIPFTLLIHMNYVIVKTVRNSHKMHGSSGIVTRQAAMESAENQLTVMLLLVTTLFFILLCPTYIRFIYLLLTEQDTPRQYAVSMFLYQVTSKLYTTNSGINFLLYCISGQKFRNDLKEILSCSSATNHSSPANKHGIHSNCTELSFISTIKSGCRA